MEGEVVKGVRDGENGKLKSVKEREEGEATWDALFGEGNEEKGKQCRRREEIRISNQKLEDVSRRKEDIRRCKQQNDSFHLT